ncbi:protein kinase [Phytophthora infestans T30-4]|uniref:Protein kinase n=1 Tax=Phytophthora infestans (strain T30-4) TaxID=403677 RepID=D0RLS8_PHYIT|nr:protein kinase [Phytophthora infestans T30-4]EEY68903.1 protein kinase [Phytophthora infestans T30-4]|eukprot:XP_002999334.1 protein kinase [Phytophthora infestans T30-4]
MEAVEIFSGANCAGTPDVLAVYNENACSDISFGNDTYYISRSCNISDRFAHTEQVFGDFTYVIMETYDNKSCTSFGEADTFLASGSCEISSGLGDQSAITILFPNGSAVVSLYPNKACGGEPSLHFELSKTALSTGSCQQDLYRFYSSEKQDTFTEFQSPRIGQKNNSLTAPGTLDSHLDDGQRGSQKPLSLVRLWDDEVIATARISREKIVIQRHLCRGGGGEVYYGLFNQQQVAIKMLLPDMRKSVKHVNAFLAEVKLMATLDHPRIVQFVGVAWDSLTDLCVVSEFMEGGDLWGLLTRYQNENHPTGFDRTKVTIALHVAHALTYLHSLETPPSSRTLVSPENKPIEP